MKKKLRLNEPGKENTVPSTLFKSEGNGSTRFFKRSAIEKYDRGEENERG